MKLVLASLMLLCTVTVATAATTILREGGDLNGDGAMAVPFDNFTIIDNLNDPDNPGYGAKNETDFYFSTSEPNYGLLGYKNLFDYLPADPNDIQSVILTIVLYQGDNDYLHVDRVLTDWMQKDAGENQTTTTWYESLTDDGSTWANGDFSTADYTTSDRVTVNFDSNVYAEPYNWDVTDQVKAMYTDGNHGWLVHSDPGLGVYPYANSNTSLDRQPYITIMTAEAPALMADFNNDNIVDVIDLGILAGGWQTDAGHAGGDANDDGIVDVIDLGILAGEWQQVAAASSAVPEPATLSLLAFAGLALAKRRR